MIKRGSDNDRRFLFTENRDFKDSTSLDKLRQVFQIMRLRALL